MNQQNQTIKRSGFVYSKGTKKGFLRMQHLGIPKPPFRIEDKLTRRLSKIYKAYITKLILDFIQKAKESNANFENGKIVSDGADKIEKALKNAEKSNTNTSHSLIENKVAVQNALFQLENAWKSDFFLEFVQSAKLEDLIDKSLTAGIDDFSKKILEDSSDKMSEILTSFSIDKKEVFAQNMANLKKLYIDDSLKRIQGEADFLKKTFLEKLTDYIQGNSDTFDIAAVVKSLNQSSAKGARFFARDQMQKFNKAQTLATFSSAGVKTIKWCTCRDVRVRQSHKDLDGKIFPITDLPKEINDYNCRCGLVPVEYYDDDFVGDSAFVSDSDFDESEHNRDEKGRFAEKESSKETSNEKKLENNESNNSERNLMKTFLSEHKILTLKDFAKETNAEIVGFFSNSELAKISKNGIKVVKDICGETFKDIILVDDSRVIDEETVAQVFKAPPFENAIMINRKHEFWSNQKKKDRILSNCSTQNENHLFFHEYGHKKLPSLPYKWYNDKDKELAKKISFNSSFSPDEFQAELFAAKALGKKIPKEIIDLYEKYGGNYDNCL